MRETLSRWALVLSCSLLSGSAMTARGGTIVYNFNDGTLDGLIPSFQTSGFSYSVSGGVLNVSSVAGTGNGGVSFQTPFNVTGDFTAAIDATRLDFPSGGDMVIEMLLPGGYLDIYFNGPTSISSNTDATRGLGNHTADSNTTVNLKIGRVGNTLSTSFSDDGGMTYSTLLSATDASFGEPTPIIFIFGQEGGNTAAQSGYFDNFTITSDSISTGAAPLPSSAWSGLVLLGAMGLAGVRRRLRAAP